MLDEVVRFVRSYDEFVIVHHYDADGLTAAAIIATALKRLGKSYVFYTARQLNADVLAELPALGRNFVFVDLGSGSLRLLNRTSINWAVIDHHKPAGQTDRPHFNPHLIGWDGATDISGAGAAYLVAKRLGQNVDLSKLAIIGAVGDMQDSEGRLVGLNRHILADGRQIGLIDVRQDIRLFGRHSRPLTQFLSYCTDPYLPGLTADETACRNFLHSIGIPLRRNNRWLYYVDLTPLEQKRLVSALYIYGREHGVSERALRALVGEVYEFTDEPMRSELRDAREFATLLNACGRHDRPSLGLAVCMGDRGEMLKKAHTLLHRHRKALRDAIEWVRTEGIKQMRGMYVVDAGDRISDTIIGIVGGMLYGTRDVIADRPIVAMALDKDGMVKASARATRSLVRRGIDLGAIMREAAEAVGGEGGGHSIAAGARFEPRMKERFLKIVNRRICEIIKAARSEAG